MQLIKSTFLVRCVVFCIIPCLKRAKLDPTKLKRKEENNANRKNNEDENKNYVGNKEELEIKNKKKAKYKK